MSMWCGIVWCSRSSWRSRAVNATASEAANGRGSGARTPTVRTGRGPRSPRPAIRSPLPMPPGSPEVRLDFTGAPGCRAPAGTRTALVALAEGLRPRRLEVQVVVGRDPLLRRLNRDFRGRDRATDVLSFLYAAERQGPNGARGAA